MHDWTLVSIFVNWVMGTVTITFKNYESKEILLIAEGLEELRVPRRAEWGESVSVNEVTGPTKLDNGNYHLMFEIQSGDKIEIEARVISMPEI